MLGSVFVSSGLSIVARLLPSITYTAEASAKAGIGWHIGVSGDAVSYMSDAYSTFEGLYIPIVGLLRCSGGSLAGFSA